MRLSLQLEFVRPKLVAALGATALHALTGHSGALGPMRGRKLELPGGGALMVTVHPSFLLRLPDRSAAEAEQERFLADLRAVKTFIDRRGDGVRHTARPGALDRTPPQT